MKDPQAVLSILIPIYAIAVVLNAVISGLLYARQRDPLTRAMLVIWLAALGALLIQGALGVTLPRVLVGLTSVLAVSGAIARLLSIVSGVEVPWRTSLLLVAAGWAFAAVAILADLPFALITGGVVLGVAWPLLSTSVAMLVRRRGRLSSPELGMALATGARMLLLDEPMAGLGGAESTAMTALLAGLKGQLTILLVEHDMDAVFALADHLTVMVNGQVIAGGAPAQVRADPNVQSVYLGEETAHG